MIYELIDASLQHPGLIVDVWGPQWGECTSPFNSMIGRTQRDDLRRGQHQNIVSKHPRSMGLWVLGRDLDVRSSPQRVCSSSLYVHPSNTTHLFLEAPSRSDPLVDAPGCNTVWVQSVFSYPLVFSLVDAPLILTLFLLAKKTTRRLPRRDARG